LSNKRFIIALQLIVFTFFQSENGVAQNSPTYDSIYSIMSYAVDFDKENIDSFYYWNEYSISLANNSLKSKLSQEELTSLRASYYNNLAVYWQKLGEVRKGMAYMDSAIYHGQTYEKSGNVMLTR
jgi:hypothetical protein